MIISLSGFGNSGSSAVLDYLKQYNDLCFFDKFEFQFLHEADGILDLKYHISSSQDRIACHSAIVRFLELQKSSVFSYRMRSLIGKNYDKWFSDYVSDIIQVSWKGANSVFDPPTVFSGSSSYVINRIQYLINSAMGKANKRWHFPPYNDRYFSLLDDVKFNSITKKHLKKLLKLMGFDEDKHVVIDMLFSATNASNGMEFFDDPIALVVVRDPRDLFFSSKHYLDDSRFMPNYDVNKYCLYYKAIMDAMKKNSNKDDRIIIVQYEDLIYQYFETTEKIKKTINIKCTPEKEFSFFDPTFSVRYTNQEKMYSKYREEYNVIEKELSDFFYNFDSAKSPLENDILLQRIKNVGNSYVGIKEKY